MEQPTNPTDETAGERGEHSALEALRGEPRCGRRRSVVPLEQRTQRLHRFTGRLVAALDDATAGGVDGVRLATLNAVETGDVLLDLERVIAQLQGLKAAVLAHADASAMAASIPGPVAVNTAAWLADAALVHGRVAHRAVKRSVALVEAHPAVGSALLAGDLDAEQAEVITTALDGLPGNVSAEDRVLAEKHLLTEAQRLDAVRLRMVAKHLLAVINPEKYAAAEERRLLAEEAHADAETTLTLWDDRHGTTHVFAKMPTRHAQMLRKALQAIANPQLTDAIARTSPLPAAAGEDGAGPAETASGDDKGEVAAADSAGAPATEGSTVAGTTVAADATLPRPTGEIMGEALVRLIETLDLDKLPTSGGLNAAVMVTMDLDTLLGGIKGATLDTGGEISPGEARRMACAAGVIPVVLGTDSDVLDHGRRHRLFTPAQRKALAIRQHHTCGATGCDRPAAWGDAHHLIPWSHDGPTDLDNGVILCARHHTLAHQPGHVVRREPGHRVSITRKPRETPRRH